MTDREMDLHNEANRIAHELFIVFYAKLKNSSIKEMTGAEAISMVTDSCSTLASQVVGSIYFAVKDSLSDFITEDMVIETMRRAFLTKFKCFVKLQNNKPEVA